MAVQGFQKLIQLIEYDQNWMGRKEQAMALAIAADLQDQLLFKRLIDFLDATVH